MKLKHWFIVQVFMSTANGLGALLMPVLWLGMYGMADINAATAITARALGAALFNYGVVAFFARDSQDSIAQKAIVIGFCLTHFLGGLVLAYAAITGVMSALAWLGVFFYWLMAAGYAYFWFLKKE